MELEVASSGEAENVFVHGECTVKSDNKVSDMRGKKYVELKFIQYHPVADISYALGNCVKEKFYLVWSGARGCVG